MVIKVSWPILRRTNGVGKRCSKYNHDIDITQHRQRNLFLCIALIIYHTDNILSKVGKSRFDLYFMLDMNV
jgi:hypothetical protein